MMMDMLMFPRLDIFSQCWNIGLFSDLLMQRCIIICSLMLSRFVAFNGVNNSSITRGCY